MTNSRKFLIVDSTFPILFRSMYSWEWILNLYTITKAMEDEVLVMSICVKKIVSRIGKLRYVIAFEGQKCQCILSILMFRNVWNWWKNILNIFMQFCLSIIFMHFTIIWFGPLNFFDTFWSFFIIVKIEMFIHCRTFLNQKNRTVHCELGISNMYTYLSTPCFMMQRGFKQLFVSKEFHKKRWKKPP